LKNNIILSILLLILISILKLNLRVYKSYTQQIPILRDINYGTSEFDKFYEDMEVDFPNTSVTSMNLKTVKSRYLIKENRFDEALELLNTVEYDPLHMKEIQKAEIFYTKGQLDSLLFYSKKAWESLPLNQAHLIWYLKSLVLYKKNSEIVNIYENYKERMDVIKWLYFYFTTAFNIIDDSNNELILAQAKETYHKFKYKDDPELNTILFYIIFGRENFKESTKLSEEAAELFSKKDFANAAKKYEMASNKFPINPDHYYNAMASLFQINKNEQILEIYSKTPDSIIPKNGSFEFLVARSYLNMKDTLNSCIYFNKSNELGMDASLTYLKNLCNN